MKTLVRLLKRALVSGSSASVASTVALLHGGVRDCRSAIAPVNAVSHWVWADKALRQQDSSWRYSVAGYCIHHAASVFWAVAYEYLVCRCKPQPSKKQALAIAGGVAAMACVVDMKCTPERLTPGFERRLGKPALAGVYVAFGLGLVLHTLLSSKKP
ncbi:hypothetical protein [Pollutimonas thiosulfatoxidans]|uniref:DUF2938 domain-containing protein n=1 Tax=Pollutimonas thiosulfatoxidans TaxID=2028345 RepID=A0A410GDJ4_9BURK|nr:hypothetical protein [Pollutimonas thiosulfatoxidans]MBF6617482.1 hypothetical protein [Candidimonas sp.]NYT44092.1 hypothetical protein [Alcaligenaceae bacterium]QAA94344.1 hypothetical protein CKA81_11245 [Pollutimonas thiosulfatoxidans]